MYMQSSLGHSFTRMNGTYIRSAATFFLWHLLSSMRILMKAFKIRYFRETQNTLNQNYNQIIFASHEAY